MCVLNTGTNTNTAAHYLLYELPDEVLLTIFNYFLEIDLCRMSQVCKRFQAIANDTELWKSLYQQVYQYDLPLFNPAPCKFEFVSPDDSDYPNPWKESFRQLYRGVHVRPGFQDLKFKGRNLPYFNTIQGGLDYVDECRSNNASNTGSASSSSTSSQNSVASSSTSNSQNNCCGNNTQNTEDPPQHIIFLHAGTYRGEFLIIDSDVALIGAAPGNVAESVILDRDTESTMVFGEGARRAYAGHLTLKFTPEVTSTIPHHKHYCLEIGENCSPTIDHCIIRSSSAGKYLYQLLFCSCLLCY